jgi:hypothetical protein
MSINKILAGNTDRVLEHFDTRLQCKTLHEIYNTKYHNYITIFNWNVQEIQWYTMLAWSSQLMTWITTTGMMGTVQSPILVHGGTMDVTPGICSTWMPIGSWTVLNNILQWHKNTHLFFNCHLVMISLMTVLRLTHVGNWRENEG